MEAGLIVLGIAAMVGIAVVVVPLIAAGRWLLAIAIGAVVGICDVDGIDRHSTRFHRFERKYFLNNMPSFSRFGQWLPDVADEEAADLFAKRRKFDVHAIGTVNGQRKSGFF